MQRKYQANLQYESMWKNNMMVTWIEKIKSENGDDNENMNRWNEWWSNQIRTWRKTIALTYEKMERTMT